MNKIKYEFFDWIESIVIAVVVVTLLFTFVFKIVTIDGESMVPTLQNDDRVIVSQLFYTPKQGDIVVLSVAISDKPYIKRIIAMEGQKVDINFDTGKVWVDDTELNEPYVNDLTFLQGNMTFPVVVPEGKVFVLGDNRNRSQDSRFSIVGFIDISSIIGHAIFRLLPVNSFGALQ